MSRLFLKIFLSFWLAVVLIVAGTGWLNLWVLETYGPSAVPTVLRERLSTMVNRTADAIRIRGQAVVPPGPARRMIHVFDAEGRDINPAPLPPHLRHLAQPGEPPNRVSGRDHEAVTVMTRDGRRYRVVGALRLPPGLLAGGRRGAVLRLLVAIAVSTLVCWLLAWYLSRPIRRLRWAAVGLGKGDLARRVSEAGDYARDEIGELARDFDRMAERLARARAIQQQLLRDVSHELRSPLARLQVALELARERGDPEALDRIELEAGRLDRLIADILELSRGLAGDQAPSRAPVDLARLLERIAEDASFEGSRTDKPVRYLGPGSLAAELDAQLIARAVENVVRNALSYAPAGEAVELELSAVDGAALITVSDRGPGVPEDQLGRIFEPFHRVDDARTTGGHGIGLAIAAAAIHAHAGKITARNRAGGGLEVSMQLPLAAGQTGKEERPSAG